MRATAKQYADAWYEQLKDSPADQWDTISNNMLTIIRQDGNMRMLTDILRLAEERQLHDQGKTAVTVRSAYPMDEQEAKEAVASLLPDTEAVITSVTDPELIGGIQVETKNTRWDMSLRGQLRSISKSIKE